jgi:hypothetical protein
MVKKIFVYVMNILIEKNKGPEGRLTIESAGSAQRKFFLCVNNPVIFIV